MVNGHILPKSRKSNDPPASSVLYLAFLEPPMLRALLSLACFLLLADNCLAELRIIAVQVVNVEKAKPKVAIYSDVKAENKRDLSIDEAAKILKNAEGWQSSVIVGIQAHDVPLAEYLPLLKAVAENSWLDLAFVEGRKPNFLFDNLKKRMTQTER
jgi:hypothetical protein